MCVQERLGALCTHRGASAWWDPRGEPGLGRRKALPIRTDLLFPWGYGNTWLGHRGCWDCPGPRGSVSCLARERRGERGLACPGAGELQPAEKR